MEAEGSILSGLQPFELGVWGNAGSGRAHMVRVAELGTGSALRRVQGELGARREQFSRTAQTQHQTIHRATAHASRLHPPRPVRRVSVNARHSRLDPPPRHEMSGTPRVRYGAFPQTPDTAYRAPRSNGTPDAKHPRVRAPLSDINIMNKSPANDGTQPLISTEVIPAPTQRLYAFFFYGALLAWRAYDFINLHNEEADSLWLFMKWIVIDGLFLFGLPVLRIPWLEWSPPTMVFLFLVHALMDGMLMFRIGVSLRRTYRLGTICLCGTDTNRNLGGRPLQTRLRPRTGHRGAPS